MNINDGDLIRLRKDIERVRQHEEKRRSREGQEEEAPARPSGPEPAPVRDKSPRPPSVPIAVRLRRVLETLIASTESSDESMAAIPEHVVTLLQVIGEEPKFKRWLLAIETLPPALRKQQLEKMSFAFRVEDGNSVIAESFDRLRETALFKAFCETLRDEKSAS